MTYKDEVVKSMNYLAEDDRIIFIGQGINYWDCIYGTMDNIPIDKKTELPIAEEMQMGISIGLSLNGFIPVSIYSRMDFLLLAMNQLVNHLDKLEELSHKIFKPKVIIRCLVGAKNPLYPGLQHCQNHTNMLKACLTNIDVVEVLEKGDVKMAYKNALESNKSTIVIERRDLYES